MACNVCKEEYVKGVSLTEGTCQGVSVAKSGVSVANLGVSIDLTVNQCWVERRQLLVDGEKIRK